MDDQRDTPAANGARHQPSRRTFVIGSAAVVAVAGGVGVALGIAATDSNADEHAVHALVPQVPSALVAAADAERALIASIDASFPTANATTKRALRAVRRDHAAHLAAIEAAIADAAYPATPSASASGSPSGSSSPAGSGPVSRSELRQAERAASKAAAARAAQLTGRNAALLASIAASEATHAEVLA